MQTTLLGLAIAFIVALVAALIGPYFIDWNQFRPQFEAEATQVLGAPVRVAGELQARLLPTPSLRLGSVVVGGPNDLGKVRADKLDVEFSLGDLMRGEWRANQLTIGGMALDLGLDRDGRIDWPASSGSFNLGSLAIDRLNLTGRVALHDAASRRTLELNDIAFSGDVRALAGALRGDGSFKIEGIRYPFRVSSGQNADGNGTRLHLNIDPGQRPLSADLDGVLSFEARAPRFEGALTLAAPVSPKAKDGGAAQAPWRISTKLKADHAAAKLEQVEATFGSEDRALKFAGQGDMRFGASPLLHVTLSARQLDADRFLAGDNAKDKSAEAVRLVPALQALTRQLPYSPLPAQIELSIEQIMLAGRPLQNLSAQLHADAASWAIDRLELRAPGATQVAFSGARSGAPGSFAGTLDIESSDPDVLVAWLQGRGEVSHRSQTPLRLHGDVSATPDRVAVEGLKAEVDGGAVEGHLALSRQSGGGGSQLEAALRAERLDLDAAAAFARWIAGPPADWPDRAVVSLDVGRAISSGQELRPFAIKIAYTPKTVWLDQLKLGQAGGATVEGTGHFDRTDATGTLSFSAGAASLGQLTAMVAPLAPTLAQRLNATGTAAGPARVKLALNIGNGAAADRADAHATFDLSAPQLSGLFTVHAKPEVSAIRNFDLDAIRGSEITVESKLSSERVDSLLVLLGLDHIVAAGPGPAQIEGSLSGTWRAPLRLNLKVSGSGIDAEARGTAEPWAQDPKASVDLRARGLDLAPLFGLKAFDGQAKNISLSSHVSLAGNKLTFDDLDATAAASRLRGHLALTLGDDKEMEGEVGLDALDLAPALALAIGAAGRDAGDPLGSGLLKGWHGRVAFQALRGVLPGGGELRPVSGAVKSDGQTLTFDAIKGKIGGGEASANIDARESASGLALNASVELKNVDGGTLRYRGLQMPSSRVSLQMALSSQGRSISALTGALSGNGTATLEEASIMGLDPRAFEVAIRAGDSGQPTDNVKLRQLVEPVLSAGALLVASAQIPFTIRDGRLRVGATTLDADGLRAIVSGGYDIPADQVDIRATLTSTAIGSSGAHPEIQLFAAGPPNALNRTVDVTSLSSWLAVRAIDRETRRLDSIERGEQVPPESPSIPPSTAALPSAAPPPAQGDQPLYEAPLPGRDLRHLQPKAKTNPPHPPGVPPASGFPPALSQQVAPLPPPIEVRPAPGPTPAPTRPKPRPPLVLTPPAQNP